MERSVHFLFVSFSMPSLWFAAKRALIDDAFLPYVLSSGAGWHAKARLAAELQERFMPSVVGSRFCITAMPGA
jgi:hypothetical protein